MTSWQNIIQKCYHHDYDGGKQISRLTSHRHLIPLLFFTRRNSQDSKHCIVGSSNIDSTQGEEGQLKPTPNGILKSHKKPGLSKYWGLNMAEEQRFELWNGFPSTVFKTVAFSHSATPP